MAKENLLGKKVFEKIIFSSMGVEIRDFGDEEAVFSLQNYEKVFSHFSEGQDCIDSISFAPYLQIFFLKWLFNGVQERKQNIFEMLDPLEKCYIKGDISGTLIRFQKLYPKTYSKEQIKQVERQVGEGGIQALAYHLSLQMMKTQMQKVGNDSESKWQYEQKMWHLATFDQDSLFNQTVRMDLVQKMKTFNQPYQGVTFFTLGHYVTSLHTSFQKACPWVTLEQTENAVYHFILDLLHKLEAILLD